MSSLYISSSFGALFDFDRSYASKFYASKVSTEKKNTFPAQMSKAVNCVGLLLRRR